MSSVMETVLLLTENMTDYNTENKQQVQQKLLLNSTLRDLNNDQILGILGWVPDQIQGGHCKS